MYIYIYILRGHHKKKKKKTRLGSIKNTYRIGDKENRVKIRGEEKLTYIYIQTYI
jgi:hypothetical protein